MLMVGFLLFPVQHWLKEAQFEFFDTISMFNYQCFIAILSPPFVNVSYVNVSRCNI